MKILITGVHGFVGSNFVDYMRGSGHELYGLDIVQKERAGLLRTYTWEEFDAGVVPVPDAIVHLAGKAHDTKNRSAAEEYFNVNTGLTRKMFDYFLTSDCRAFVFFSTAKAAADCVEGVLTEKVEPGPVGPYGESKIEAEGSLFLKNPCNSLITCLLLLMA